MREKRFSGDLIKEGTLKCLGPRMRRIFLATSTRHIHSKTRSPSKAGLVSMHGQSIWQASTPPPLDHKTIMNEQVPPTAEEYRSLLQEVSQLRRELQSRDASIRNDIVRESRRRQQLESSLRAEFQLHTTDEESPAPPPSILLHGKSNNAIPSMGGSSSPRVSHVGFQIGDGKHDDDDDDDMLKDVIKLKEQEAATPKPDDNEAEGIEIPLLPQDTFSYLAFSKMKSTAMITAIIVICIQLTTLTVLLADSFGEGGPGNSLGFPAGVNQSTATIQVVALFIITMGQTDLQDSLNTLFIGYQEYDLSKNLQRPVKKWRWAVSLWIRITITILALAVTFLMICTESDTTQLLLDFTSIEFVTNLDNVSVSSLCNVQIFLFLSDHSAISGHRFSFGWLPMDIWDLGHNAMPHWY